MADISQVQVGSTTYDVHDATARNDVNNEIARAKKAESDEYNRATAAETALRDSVPMFIDAGNKPGDDEYRPSVPGRVFFGSVVRTYEGNNETRLFYDEDFKRVFGRSFDFTRDVVLAMNGDAGANGPYFNSCAWFHSKAIWVGTPGASNGPIRINFVVFLCD